MEADVAIGLHRWSKYTDFRVEEDGTVLDGKEGRDRVEGDPTEAFLYVLANRHGPEDAKACIRWFAETTTYESACDGQGAPL